MVRVAVAGGSSPTLGRSIVTALVDGGKHEVIVLSRRSRTRTGPGQTKEHEEDSIYGAPTVAVDYESIDSLTTALRGVHTLISVIKVTDPDTLMRYHANMLQACHAAGVSRFAPSSWTLGPASFEKVDLLAHKKDVWEMLCEDQLRGAVSGKGNRIECASFDNGMFMNYFAQGMTFSDHDDNDSSGTPSDSRNSEDKDKEKEKMKKNFALGGLVDDMMLEYIDVPHGKLVVPLDHRAQASRISMTHLDDIGKFVAAAIDLPPGQWKGHLGMAGDTCSMEEVVDLLAAKGVQIKHETITVQQCDERIGDFDRQLAQDFSIQALIGRMVAQIMRVQCEGTVDGGMIDPVLNRLCPEVKPVTIREFIDRVY